MNHLNFICLHNKLISSILQQAGNRLPGKGRFGSTPIFQFRGIGRKLVLSSIIPFLSLVAPTITIAQTAVVDTAKQAAYVRTINDRSQKIVSNLNISDSKKGLRVRDVIAAQYINLSALHASRDSAIKVVKTQTGLDKEAINQQVTKQEEIAAAKIAQLHTRYLNALSKELSAEQVDKVKDGMTYDVLHVTYKATNEMIPSLKEEEKKQIMTWLVEAREHAMDAESSEKKHAWFGKYKGKINNYLSAAGYNLTKERDEWMKRVEAAKAKSTTQQ